MKQYLFSFCISILFFSYSSTAQINHFIYLQTENKQPFYVKFNKKIISSSASGYIIIPKLQSGSYELIIGFPKNEWAEQNFTDSVKNEDVGYLVKNFGEKGWGLFNLQSLQVVMAGEKNGEATLGKVDKTDEFSNLLSNVVNDPTILKKEVEKKTEIKADTSLSASQSANEQAREQATIQKTVSVTNIDVTDNSINDSKKTEENIKKIQEKSNEAGVSIIYVDKGNEQVDTVNIFIPKDSVGLIAGVSRELQQKDEKLPVVESAKDEQSLALIAETPYTTKKSVEKEAVKLIDNSADMVHNAHTTLSKNELIDSSATINQSKEKQATETLSQTPNQNSEKFLPIEFPPVDVRQSQKADVLVDGKRLNTEISKKDIAADSANTNTRSSVLMINSDCIANASNDDFLKLRKKMASAKTDDIMLEVGKKGFKAKCFSSEQVKNLGALFLKESGRYAFFDMAYQFVWDTHNYSSLEDQLSEPYYKSRFKAMIRH